MNYSDLVSKIENHEQFAFSRWGDGEWMCLLNPNENKSNTDDHTYFHDLAQALHATLLAGPTHYLGLQRKAMKDMGSKITAYLNEHELNFDWVDADLLHDASGGGYLDNFLTVLDKRKVVIVGPRYLQGVLHAVDYNFFITIPDKNCWQKYGRVKEELQHLLAHEDDDLVVLFCASMMSNVMIHELYQEYGDWHTFIDAGSVLDPYAGKATRKYHKKLLT